VPPFSGLRRFPEGRKFKQWTGDDSKALMKVNHIHLLFFIFCNKSCIRFIFLHCKDIFQLKLFAHFVHSWSFATQYGRALWLKLTWPNCKMPLIDFMNIDKFLRLQVCALMEFHYQGNMHLCTISLLYDNLGHQMGCVHQSQNPNI